MRVDPGKALPRLRTRACGGGSFSLVAVLRPRYYAIKSLLYPLLDWRLNSLAFLFFVSQPSLAAKIRHRHARSREGPRGGVGESGRDGRGAP